MSITETKMQLFEAIDLYDQLESELENENKLLSLSEEDWQSNLRNLGIKTAKLIHTSRTLDNDNLIKILIKKKKKLQRHKEWKKRIVKKHQFEQRRQAKRNENWIKNIEWTVTITPSKCNPINTISTEDNEGKKPREKEKGTKAKIQELSRILTKLTYLRTLRRRRLEAKGNFYADDGNDFFNKVKKWNDSIEKDGPVDKKNEDAVTEAIQPAKNSRNKEDKWRNIPLDKQAYAYWCESDQSLDALLKNRRLWDHYIVENGDKDDTFHKVPPTFVSPAPPANWIWASYLL